MFLSKAEMDILRLCAWCRDLPTHESENIPAEIISILVKANLLRKTRNGESYRVTQNGYGLLQKYGFECSDKGLYRTDETHIARRYMSAEIAAFFIKRNADVFLQGPPIESADNVYLSSFELRSSGILPSMKGTQAIGYYYTGDTMFVPFFVNAESNGLSNLYEQREVYNRTLNAGRKPFIVFTGHGSYADIMNTIMSGCRKEHQTYDTYKEALEKFDFPSAVITLDDVGSTMLNILKTPYYKTKLAKGIFNENYIESKDDLFDGVNKEDGTLCIVAIDGNIPRAQKVVEAANGKPYIIYLFDFQAEIFSRYFDGEIYVLEFESVKEYLNVSSPKKYNGNVPFKTKDGRYISLQ